MNTGKILSVKAHMRQMNEEISEMKQQLSENKKNGQLLRSEHIALENKTKDYCNNILKSITSDLTSFTNDLTRIMQSDKAETEFLKQQVNGLVQDKTRLKQTVIGLESRLKQCMLDVGVEDRLDSNY